jgi:hypothetical protein
MPIERCLAACTEPTHVPQHSVRLGRYFFCLKEITMLNIYDQQTAAVVLGGDLDPHLHALIEGHLFTAKENGLSAMTHIAVIEPGDTETAIINELGFSPLDNPLTGKRFGDRGFRPHWDWLEVHPAWFELIYTVGDSGFAYILLAAKGSGPVTQLCQHFGQRWPGVRAS